MQFNLLEQLGLNTTKGIETKLNDFVKVFKSYNSHTNLISKNDEENLFEKHIYDSLAINLFLKKNGISQFKMLDIGTGGGFPSIPVAVFFDKADILAIDSISKKIGFVELAAKELMLTKLIPASKRAEDLNESDKGSFDIVTSRAVAQLNTLLEYSIPYLKIGGYFVAYKSINCDTEIENAANALKILGAELAENIVYTLPTKEKHKRQLIIIKKTGSTPPQYPRKSGNAKKCPL